jgi:hypothetical protein
MGLCEWFLLLSFAECIFATRSASLISLFSNATLILVSILHDSRPGILVLINDTDWELEGEGEYVLKDGDDIVFISTLHGG